MILIFRFFDIAALMSMPLLRLRFFAIFISLSFAVCRCHTPLRCLRLRYVDDADAIELAAD